MTQRPPHDEALAARGECNCFGCHIRGVNVGKPSDFATRTPGKAPPRKPNNSYERGVPVDSRGMPVLTANGDYMRQKEHDRKRHLIEETRRRRLNTGVI